MPLREYICRTCRTRREVIELGAPEPQFCQENNCGEQMDLVPFSRPAPVRVGKYGKAGGLAPEAPSD